MRQLCPPSLLLAASKLFTLPCLRTVLQQSVWKTSRTPSSPSRGSHLKNCKDCLILLQTALKLIETYVAGVPSNPPVGPHLNQVADELVPAMMDPILGDYARNVPDARWAM